MSAAVLSFGTRLWRAAPSDVARLTTVVLIAWALWLSSEYWALGPWSYVLLYDFGDSFIPLYIGEGSAGIGTFFGGWDPQMIAGTDAASHVIGQFRLTKLGMAVLPPWLTFGLFAFLQRAIAGCFMYRVVVDVFGGRPVPALGAAMLFAVGMGPTGAESYHGYTHNQGLGACMLPLLLWLHWRFARTPFLRAALLFVAGALVATGTMQVLAVPALICLGLLILALAPAKERTGSFLALVSLGLGYAAFEFPNVIAVAADLPQAHRIVTPPMPADERLIGSLNALRRLVVHQAVPFAAIAFALVWLGRRAFPLPIFAVFVFCLAWSFLDAVVAFSAPRPGILTSFSFIRIVYSLPFLVIVAAGIALSNAAAAADGSRRRMAPAITAVLAAALIASALGQDLWIKFNNLRYYAHGSNYPVLYENPALRQVAAMRSETNPFRVASTEFIEGTTHLHRASLALAYGLETVDGYANIYSRRYHDLWLTVVRFAEHVPFHFEKMRDWGNRLYIPAQADECRDLRIGASVDFDLLALLNVRFIISPCPLTDSDLTLFAANRESSGQAWHHFSNRRKFTSIFSGDFPSKELFVYETPNVLPRYFLAGAVRVFGSSSDLLSALGEASVQNLRGTVMVAESDVDRAALPNGPPGSVGGVRVISVARDEIHLEVAADRDAVLVIANSYNARWSAKVNGKTMRVFPAYYALQGVVVEAGRSDVVLRYRTALSSLFR